MTLLWCNFSRFHTQVGTLSYRAISTQTEWLFYLTFFSYRTQSNQSFEKSGLVNVLQHLKQAQLLLLQRIKTALGANKSCINKIILRCLFTTCASLKIAQSWLCDLRARTRQWKSRKGIFPSWHPSRMHDFSKSKSQEHTDSIHKLCTE